MFRKLRNKFILFNVGITTAVVLIVFSLIYFTALQSANRRPPMNRTPVSYTNDVRTIVAESIENERKNASNELLAILIISGFAIEICVVIISYFLANIAIKPVKEAYDSQKLFIANASHEIKTPLAAISASLEAANLSDNKWIKNAETETKKITALNKSLLNLARTDLVASSPEVASENLKAIVEHELEVFLPRIESEEKKIEFRKHLESCKRNINKADFCEVLNILLDNAVKYCDSKIEVYLDSSRLEIRNDGELIPQEKIAHIFERFYQVDKSADGVGLGLSIATSLAERNKWKINAKIDGRYNVFEVIL